jgi:hypothetical protein
MGHKRIHKNYVHEIIRTRNIYRIDKKIFELTRDSESGCIDPTRISLMCAWQ